MIITEIQTMFYFQLLNLPVQFRSKLSSISLLAVCTSKHIQKFGVKNILQDFIETVNVLGTSGLNLQINGNEFNVKGALLYAICDTPAAALLGGFKESSLAKRPCRKCYGELAEMREKFHSQDFTQRNMASHLEECSVIENPHMSKANRAFWSKFYGINGSSPLAKIKDFDITSNLVMDSMHIICKGIACNILSLFSIGAS